MGQIEKVHEQTLDTLIKSGSIRAVFAKEDHNNRYELIAQSGNGTNMKLYTRRGRVRNFAELSRLADYCKRRGIYRFDVICNREAEDEAQAKLEEDEAELA